MKTIKVTQSASGKYPPDSITIHLTVCAEENNHEQCVISLNDKTEEITRLFIFYAKLKNELETSGKAIYATKRDDKTVFAARVELNVTLPLSDKRVNSAIAAAEKSDADMHISYGLKTRAYRDELIAQAVSAAKERAEKLASAAGVKLGELCNIEYTSPFDGGVRLMRAAIAPEPEQIDATETVTCEWEIK